MPHPSDLAVAIIVRPCLQCGATIDFDPRVTKARWGRLLRTHAACLECGAIHCLLVDGGMYGLVEAGNG